MLAQLMTHTLVVEAMAGWEARLEVRLLQSESGVKVQDVAVPWVLEHEEEEAAEQGGIFYRSEDEEDDAGQKGHEGRRGGA